MSGQRRFSETNSYTDNELTATEDENKEYSRNYQTFIQQSQSDYDFIREQVKREKEEMEQAAAVAELEKDQEDISHKNNA